MLALVFTLAACSTNQLALSGSTLKAMGDSFVTTSDFYNRLYKAGKITKEDYRVWATFAKQFQPLYPLLVDAWKVIEANPEGFKGDAAKLEKQILSIKQKLLEFYAFAVDKLEVR